MGERRSFLGGWIFGIFTPHLLEPISQQIGTFWHHRTQHHLDADDPWTLVIHRQAKIQRVRDFFEIRRPGAN